TRRARNAPLEGILCAEKKHALIPPPAKKLTGRLLGRLDEHRAIPGGKARAPPGLVLNRTHPRVFPRCQELQNIGQAARRVVACGPNRRGTPAMRPSPRTVAAQDANNLRRLDK